MENTHNLTPILNLLFDMKDSTTERQENVLKDVKAMNMDESLRLNVSRTNSVIDAFNEIEIWKASKLRLFIEGSDTTCDMYLSAASERLIKSPCLRYGQALVHELPNELIELMPFGTSAQIFHEKDAMKASSIFSEIMSF